MHAGHDGVDRRGAGDRRVERLDLAGAGGAARDIWLVGDDDPAGSPPCKALQRLLDTGQDLEFRHVPQWIGKARRAPWRG